MATQLLFDERACIDRPETAGVDEQQAGARTLKASCFTPQAKCD